MGRFSWVVVELGFWQNDSLVVIYTMFLLQALKVGIKGGIYTTQWQLPQTVDTDSRQKKNTCVSQLLKYRHTYFYISIELIVIVLPVNRCAYVTQY